MATTTTTTSLAIHPWTREDAEENSLSTVLARAKYERGHFRDITEASLQEEVAAEGALGMSESESEEDDKEDVADVQKAKDKPASFDELLSVKAEIMANVVAAEQEVLMALDFVSLLLSKDAPKQAATTVSPALKSSVPLGTLGTDLWHRMPVDKAREAQDDILATNVRMQGLQQSADDLLSAASRLQDNVRRDTQYWNSVLSIFEEGWNVCRIPGQQHRLGVRYGFSESSPEFSRRGIAALNAGLEGYVTLERGIGSDPKALLATLRRNGKVVGTSRSPFLPSAEETTLEARIRYARDSLYDEELYREMIRESRILASVGVRMNGSAIQFGSDAGESTDVGVFLDLVSLDRGQIFDPDASHEEDELAVAMVLAARLLLSHAHRERLKKRSEVPAPLSDKPKDDNFPLRILRPIMSFSLHRSSLDRSNAYIDMVASMLQEASIANTHQLARFNFTGNLDGVNTETLITTLMAPWNSDAELEVSSPKDGKSRFSFSLETTLANNYRFGSVFSLHVPSRPEAYRFESLDDLIAAADAKLASTLAKELATALGGEWRCNERESLLIKDVGVGEKSQSMWISVDSGKKSLSLSSPAGKVSWVVGGESVQTGFWDAPSQILRADG